MAEHVDVLIVGAGISGIGAGCHLREECPDRSFAIFEARDAIGGTWDLFRYPGIRSDSDMHTLGFAFKPWEASKAIADGPSILDYLHETVAEYDLERSIRFRHRVVAAGWDSETALWTVEAVRGAEEEPLTVTCRFLLICSGYYRYDEGYLPEFPGAERFRGEIVHPQHWPEDLDHDGKRVVVIGSGATAVTIVPAMAATAEHVTMLQRSPTYIVSVPEQDAIADFLRRHLPERVAYAITRWKNVLLMLAVFHLSRRRPGFVRRLVRRGVTRHVPPGFDVDTHFSPRYDPWDQRMCLVPDGDLFESLHAGTSSIVTDEIEAFTEEGITLRSGRELEADVIVTATGLNMLFIGGIELRVDGRAVDPAQAMTYKSLMLGDVPNMAFCVGYTNASWTLKTDLTAAFVCRLLNHMAAQGHDWCVPRTAGAPKATVPLIDFSSGYIVRALDRLPQQGAEPPWRLRQNYAADIVTLRHRPLEDGAMMFGTAGQAAGAEPAEPLAAQPA